VKRPVTRTKKPWGEELLWAHTPAYVGKIIVVNKGKRSSLQKHLKKSETFFVLSGRMRLEYRGKKHVVGAGRAFHIEPGSVHRFSAPFGRVTLLEVSTPQLHDIVRLEDDYGRAA
jgi:mannose-6-phosphate isomerase-like protein (cupin superfamily)